MGGCPRNGITHKANGMRDVTTPEVHDVLVRRVCDKIDKNRDHIIRVERDLTAGSSARLGWLPMALPRVQPTEPSARTH